MEKFIPADSNPAQKPVALKMTRYQLFIVAVLAFIQFTIILDFMILSPLGAILMPALSITPAQFGFVVSAYAFSAGASGIMASGFADRFDRKKILLFFYTGFVIGTLLCAVAPSYQFLLVARIVTGLFGGVIGSVVFAICTDLFPLSMRGRVMGIIQTAFAGSQILGIPLGLWISASMGWHAPFFMIVGFSTAVGILIAVYMKPINEHLNLEINRNALDHLRKTISNPRYIVGFCLTALLSTGGFMLMPFGSVFSTNNLGITLEQLPLIYLIPGVFSIIAGPLIGRASDKYGHFRTFLIGSGISILMVLIYTHLGITPIGWLVALMCVMMIAVTSRMIPSQALTSAIPTPESRGAFMSVSSSIQQISGGMAAVIAGMIISQSETGQLLHFDILGYVIAATTAVSIALMAVVNRSVSTARL